MVAPVGAFPGEVAPDIFPGGDPSADMFIVFLFYLLYHLYTSLPSWFYSDLTNMWYDGATIR